MSELQSPLATNPPAPSQQPRSRLAAVALWVEPAAGVALLAGNLACAWFFRTAAVGAALALVNAVLLIAVLLAIPRHRDLITWTAAAFIGIGYGLKLYLAVS